MSRKPIYFGDHDPVVEEDDRRADHPFDFRAPIRTGVKVTPLIGGVTTYAAMERAIRRARRFVYLSGWTLEKDERVTPSGPFWIALFQSVARKVDVRVLISDLDPIGNHSRHGINWATYRALIALQRDLPSSRRGALQVIISLHSMFVDLNAVPFGLATLLVAAALTRLRSGSKALLGNLENKPLLWRNVRRDANTGQLVLAADDQLDLRTYPASHHQKFCVVDGDVAFAGGIDIASPRANPEAWRDVNCMLKGTIVGDLEAAFVERWNRERVRFERFLAKATRDLAVFSKRPSFALPEAERITALSVNPLQPPEGQPSPRPPGQAWAQMRRTVSRSDHRDEDLEAGRKSVPLAAPTLRLDEVWKTYERAITVAEKLVYIENQYVRDPRIGGLLSARMAAVNTLCAIILMPQRVEEKDKHFTPHGNYLQAQIVKGLTENFGRQGRFGAFQVRAFRPYAHSKVVIVDDVFAVIGSANANARSFGLDSELDIAWHEPASVHSFRLQLWAGILGMSAPEVNKTPLESSVALFARVAAKNARTLGGVLLPHKPPRPCPRPAGEPCQAQNVLLDAPMIKDVM
jgi:phosphatidylserine/phosphatidylglycerophosphate/cardiolipin synthase-like enzyme